MARRVVNTQELRDWREFLKLKAFAVDIKERQDLWYEAIENLENGYNGLNLGKATVDSLILDALSHALANDEGLDEWVYDHTPEGWSADGRWPEIRKAAAATIYQIYLNDREKEEKKRREREGKQAQ